MATLYVTEYASLGDSLRTTGGEGNAVQAVIGPPAAEQTVAIGGSAASPANVFGPITRIVRLHCDAICSVRVGGTAPTATTSSGRMVAGQTEYFRVKPGDTVSVISNT